MQKFEKRKIGVIGLGAVGGAVFSALASLGHDMRGFDSKYPEQRLENLLDREIIFISLPTPSRPDGSCDAGIIEETLATLERHNFRGLITIKSTIIPGTTDTLHDKFPELRLAHNPEFLREKYAQEDFLKHQDLCVIGAYNQADAELLESIHRGVAKDIVWLSPKEAEAVKYFTNSFNATRVLFSTEFYELMRKLGISYEKVKNAAVKRYNIEDHYLDCNDSLMGFGGKCLPKDAMALAHLSKEVMPERDFFPFLVRENAKYKKLFMTPDKPALSILILTQKVSEADFDLWFFIRWINTFAKYFAEVKVICLEEGRYDPLPKNVEVVSLGKELGNLKIARLFNFYRYLLRFLPQVDGVFIHMNQIYAILGWPLYILFGKKKALWYNHRTVNWDARLAAHLVDAVLTASYDTFPYKTKNRVATGHGIDTNFYRPMDEIARDKTFRLLSLGRITETKNQMLMCQAVKALKDKGVRVLLDIYSLPALDKDWEYYGRIKQYIQDNQLEDRIFLKGRAENFDMPKIYNSHDLFLNLAGKTGIDKVVLEAMACGLNVLTSNGTFKPLVPGENFIESLSLEHLARKIEEFSQRPGKKNLALREEVVKRHNLDDLIQRFYDFYAFNH
ncbi:MAG: glycosyltransferase [Candidatus Sungbacteria bacterium]|uniref:Glycosyltransferase n=1 Tax=Candidatus Sungiibacteriota bacterium TaxID=2750080 RepID=A0A9D6LQZ0_9BACT|nr:glycosyltransferase [Candidatus Sungbacteria bacterium]